MGRKSYLVALLIAVIVYVNNVYSQGVGINGNNNPPDNSAMLDVSSVTKGVLFPRLNTTQMTSIISPALGLTIFNTDSLTFCLYTGTQWKCLCVCSGGGGIPPIADAGVDQTICNGSSATLTAGGGVAYVWNTNETTTSITVNPLINTTYTVTTSNAYGTDSDEVVVTVVTATANAGLYDTISDGQTDTLTATGGISYIWSTGSTSDTTIVSPVATMTYTVTVTDANGCTDSDEVVIVLDSSYCQGTVTCPGATLTDTRDGQVYDLIQIGSQCWMAENLNYGTQINHIAASPGVRQTNNGSVEKFCYSDNAANCTTYGGLYEGGEMMDYDTLTEGIQGICPTGWHIPSDNEWKCMEMTLGMSKAAADSSDLSGGPGSGWRGTNQGTQLKSGGTSGFNALLSGESGGGSFNYLFMEGAFWTSTYGGVMGSWFYVRAVQSGKTTVLNTLFGWATNPSQGYIGASVRCIKD